MKSIAQGNLQQLRILFDRYNVHLYNFFLKQCRDKMLSEDFTQSVFERIIQYRVSYSDGYKFKPWIFKIARNIINDHYRKNRIETDQNIAMENVSTTVNSVDYEIERKERMSELDKAISLLGNEDKQIIFLSKIQEMRYADVADTMNITEAAVKIKVHRAIKKLRKIYSVNTAI